MMKESYERKSLIITRFATEDVIATSGPGGGGYNPGGGDDPGTGGGGSQQVVPNFVPDYYEMPIGF